VLARELVRQGEALRILVRPNSDRSGLELPGVEFIRGDVTDYVAVRKASPVVTVSAIWPR